MIERMVVELPPGSTHTVSDITIGGEPVRYGGQIAECITVKLVGGATKLGSVQNGLSPCLARCCLDPANATRLRDPIRWGIPTPVGFVDALDATPPAVSSEPTLIAHHTAPLADVHAAVRPHSARSRARRVEL